MSPPGHVSKCKIVQNKKGHRGATCTAGEAKHNPLILRELFALEFPRFLAAIGPKQIQAMKPFVTSAITFGVTGAILLVYMTEWKAVVRYLPYYSGKYSKPGE